MEQKSIRKIILEFESSLQKMIRAFENETGLSPFDIVCGYPSNVVSVCYKRF